jgi:hypothetical protein
MDAEGFRRVALALPEATEGAHHGHPDFRVRGRIFATLHPDGAVGVVMLTPSQQAARMAGTPGVFTPAAGAWGARGCTQVLLRAVKAALLRAVLQEAWRNKAPAALGKDLGGD